MRSGLVRRFERGDDLAGLCLPQGEFEGRFTQFRLAG